MGRILTIRALREGRLFTPEEAEMFGPGMEELRRRRSRLFPGRSRRERYRSLDRGNGGGYGGYGDYH